MLNSDSKTTNMSYMLDTLEAIRNVRYIAETSNSLNIYISLAISQDLATAQGVESVQENCYYSM